MSSSVLSTFVGAIQASASVLLTIFYGVIAGQTKLLSVETGRQISKICIKMFLPALLVVNLGSQIEASNASQYLIILAWALVYNLTSIAVGYVLTKFLNMPKWFTPAITFNNTTSYPLLLIQSLGSAGVLSNLAKSDDDTSDAIIDRAKSFFLVCSVISNMLTFGLGGTLLGVSDEDPVDTMDRDLRDRAGHNDTPDESGADEENGQDGGESNERTSLLPGPLPRYAKKASRGTAQAQHAVWDRLHPRIQHGLALTTQFISPPSLGATLGIILAFVPPLKKAFFADSEDGGIFNAWLTVSLKNIGELFVTLQVIVVGIKLAHSLRRMRRGHDSGNLHWAPMTLVVLIRFLIWPVLSILFIRLLITKTDILGQDRVLWFTMMLMPAGPPAMKLVAMAEMDDADENDKMSIARVLMTCYAVSPLLSFAVVASLKACT
ncbi:auxin efflux carrier [Fusarium tricinctum]|uniref:Auxin efflux carrier n=1 Tax=Fusarium tricinctum TaxID=61284 RepID=A0A8K0RLW3_9HYPO|nr:auxin efflux carrier [Fusarium tricinctum]